MAYAEGTAVEFERSIAEIITLIKRHGAVQIGQMEGEGEFTIGFKMADRLIKFVVPLVTRYDGPAKGGNGRTIDAAKVVAQQNRQKGRALLLVIKAKLESVESGIETIEQAFLANVVMLDGVTVYERIARPIAIEYDTGTPNTTLALAGPKG